MDRLRALRYLEVAAGAKSFSAAARHFEVSVTAVAKLIGALENDWACAWSSGISRPAHDGVGCRTSRPPFPLCTRSTMPRTGRVRRYGPTRPARRRCSTRHRARPARRRAAALPRALPGYRADIRDYDGAKPDLVSGVDVILALGRPPRSQDLVHRVIASGRFLARRRRRRTGPSTARRAVRSIWSATPACQSARRRANSWTRGRSGAWRRGGNRSRERLDHDKQLAPRPRRRPRPGWPWCRAAARLERIARYARLGTARSGLGRLGIRASNPRKSLLPPERPALAACSRLHELRGRGLPEYG